MISITVLLQWAGLVNQLSLFSQHQSSLEIYVAEQYIVLSSCANLDLAAHTDIIGINHKYGSISSSWDHSIRAAAAAGKNLNPNSILEIVKLGGGDDEFIISIGQRIILLIHEQKNHKMLKYSEGFYRKNPLSFRSFNQIFCLIHSTKN